jgi:hypothetical protein
VTQTASYERLLCGCVLSCAYCISACTCSPGNNAGNSGLRSQTVASSPRRHTWNLNNVFSAIHAHGLTLLDRERSQQWSIARRKSAAGCRVNPVCRGQGRDATGMAWSRCNGTINDDCRWLLSDFVSQEPFGLWLRNNEA